MSAHDEWSKTLANGKNAKYIYDEIVGVCSIVVEVDGVRVFSRADLPGPMTREEVEALAGQSFRQSA